MFDTIKNAFSGLWNSFIRTVIPIIVAAIVAGLIKIGIPVDDTFADAIAGFLGAIAGALYYLIIRVVERIKPKLSVLLGSVKQPVYVVPEATSAVEKVATIANATEEASK